jgi:ectoine hydroxylase-related dioxygenase (phytanoyl-CoA dioxygenase family)
MAGESSLPAMDDAPVAVQAQHVAEHVQHVADHGYTIVEDAIEPELVDSLRRELERFEQFFAVEPAGNSFEGFHTLRIYNLLALGRIFELVPVHPNVLPIVEGVLDRGCLISSLSSISIQPGEVAQPIHADDQLIPIPKPHPPTVCNSMWALTDFTEENGATRIIPGSHLSDRSPDYGAAYDSLPAAMPAGSVLIWHGSLWHGGGANASADTRMGIAMNYCAGYIRQQENQQLGLSRETVEQFSPRLRELVGYGVYNMLIGHINKQSPESLLLDRRATETTKNERQSRTMVWDGI